MSLISCKQLSKQYAGKTVLNNIDIELVKGKPIALVGPNGAGKTTFLSILSGFISPSSGSISINGQEPNHPQNIGKISTLPQDALLDPHLSITKQLTFFARLQGFSAIQAKEETKRVLELVGLTDSAQQKPTSLSHGMAKRVSIAQALIGQPELVLLDEPTAGLDPIHAKQVRQIVDQLSTTTTFIISSHNLEELEQMCDQVLYLEQGKLTRHLSLNAQQETAQLTLTMSDCEIPTLINELEQLEYVVEIKQKNKQTLIIEHRLNSDSPLQLEHTVLELCSRYSWQYKAIYNGIKLEDSLFS